MRLALIGCGRRASALVRDLVVLCPDLQVCGMIDPDPSAVTRLPEPLRDVVRKVDTVSELLATRPDALMVGTRCDLHAPFAVELAAVGLPLLLEKPVGITLEQGMALERAFPDGGRRVVVSFPLRFTPLYRQVREVLRTQQFGPCEHVLAVNYVAYGDVYFSTWFRDYAVTRGLFVQKATHDFDYLMDAVGSPIVRVAAMASHGRVYRDASTRRSDDPPAHWRASIGTPESGMNEDSSSALLEFANGTRGVYTQVFFTRRNGKTRGATFSGLEGTLSFDWYRRSLDLHWHHRPVDESQAIECSEDHWGGDEGMLRNFIEVIEGKALSCATLADGLRSLYASLAAAESARCGTFVDVRQPVFG